MTQPGNVSLVELVDRIVASGVVVVGDVTLSVADVDLLYVGLRLVLTPAHKGPTVRSLLPTDRVE